MKKSATQSRRRYPEYFHSLIEVFEYFNSEKRATQYLQYRRWKGNPICPHCEHDKICCFSDGKRFKCKGCKKQFTARIGTIFECSKISLCKWFIAIHMVTAHKKGQSSHQMARHLKVTQPTAWFMLQRIRHLLGVENSQDEPLEGVIESDESFIGGKNRNRHFKKRCKKCSGRDWRDKTPVLGFVQSGKGGKARTIVMPNTKGNTMLPLILKNVSKGAILVSDEYQVYKSIGPDITHEFVQHRLGSYVNECGFTTNSVEGFWTWIKRMIVGVYHNVSRKYLQYYCHEATFRYNTRALSDGERMIYALTLNSGPLKYKHLTKP